MKFFEENELAEVVCAMIATFASVCGIKHYPSWAQQSPVDRQRYVESVEELLDMLANHQATQDAQDAAVFDVAIWYRDNWRIFPWPEPEFSNLSQLNQEFVVQVAEFSSVMAGHYSTELTEDRDE